MQELRPIPMNRSAAITLIFTLLIALALVGCGGQGTTTPSGLAGATETPASPTLVQTPTAFLSAIDIASTPTARPHPPTPTLVPPPAPAHVVPTDTRQAEPADTETQATPTPVPSPTDADALAPIASETVLIPAGPFIMGSANEDERPPHEVFVEAYEIDKFEVANDEFQRFVDETGYATEGEQAGEEDSWRAWAQDKPRHPVVKVTFGDARAYCEWAGKRLPTEAEWEKAARGTEQLVYPWGNEWDPDGANTKESGYRGTTAVGSFPQGASPYGAMDMAGNVAEWTTDWFKAYPGGDFASPYFGEQYRVIRGGGWFTEQELVRTTERSASSEDLRNDDVGFRCAAPAS
jgi:formylglycine-generating enzyme required for sulfatase activity